MKKNLICVSQIVLNKLSVSNRARILKVILGAVKRGWDLTSGVLANCSG